MKLYDSLASLKHLGVFGCKKQSHTVTVVLNTDVSHYRCVPLFKINIILSYQCFSGLCLYDSVTYRLWYPETLERRKMHLDNLSQAS